MELMQLVWRVSLVEACLIIIITGVACEPIVASICSVFGFVSLTWIGSPDAVQTCLQ